MCIRDSRYTVPSYLHPEGMEERQTIRFRVDRVYQGASICVYFDEKQVQRKKRRILAPGEMEPVSYTHLEVYKRQGPYEAFFADMAFWPTVCYCESCRKRWAEEVGGEMPTVVDWKDPRWLKFQEKRCQWLGEFQQAVYDAVKEANPACSVEQQNSVMLSPLSLIHIKR